MKKQWLWIIALSFGLFASCLGGELHVRGPVSGKWTAGTRVFVESEIWVTSGEALVVEEGVEIQFLTNEQFVIDGNLHMEGTSQAPITLKPFENWEGMYFNYNGDLNRWHVLRYVNVDPSGSIAKRILETDRVSIRIENCNFVSQQNSIRIVGGLVQASDNSFLTFGVSSKVLEIRHLNPFRTNTPDQSYLLRNLIQIDGESPHSVGIGTSGAFGLFVRGSTDLIIRENAIQLWKVRAPSYGIDFRVVGDEDIERWTVDSCVVKVVTEGRWACAVQCDPDDPDKQHFVDLVKSTFDIAVIDPIPAHRPLLLYARDHSTFDVNSVAIHARSSGDDPIPYSIGEDTEVEVFVQYSVRYHETMEFNSLTEGTGNIGNIRSKPSDDNLYPLTDGPEGFGSATDLPPGVNEFEVITDQNPGFVGTGEEGIWTSLSQVEDYYSLEADSPCRDAGDPNLDNNSGSELPDAGRYDFVPTSISPVVSGIPTEFRISLAYPNPFNPSTTIPLELNKSAHIRMIVYDILGRVASDLVNQHLTSGQYYIEFSGTGLASGVYFLNVEYDGQFVGSQRLILLK